MDSYNHESLAFTRLSRRLKPSEMLNSTQKFILDEPSTKSRLEGVPALLEREIIKDNYILDNLNYKVIFVSYMKN